MPNSTHFRVLPGLPGSGPPPLQFNATGQGMHREGFVVEFTPPNAPPWVGNFHPGLSSFCGIVNDVTAHNVIVVSRGQGYVVSLATGELRRSFGGGIELLLPIPDLQAVLMSNGLWFELCRGELELWRTKRLSWDGIRNVTMVAGVLHGEGWRFDESWHPFEIDLSTGATRGGHTMDLTFNETFLLENAESRSTP